MSILEFFKKNLIAFGIGAFFLVLYLQFTFAGNRICDCQATEKYKPASTGTHRAAYIGNRFYHK